MLSAARYYPILDFRTRGQGYLSITNYNLGIHIVLCNGSDEVCVTSRALNEDKTVLPMNIQESQRFVPEGTARYRVPETHHSGSGFVLLTTNPSPGAEVYRMPVVVPSIF